MMTTTTTMPKSPLPAMDLEVRPLGREFDEERAALVPGIQGGSFFHLPLWRDFVGGLYGHRSMDLGAFSGEELVGVFPLMLCRGLLGSRKLVSMPFSVYGGPAGLNREVQLALIRGAEDLGHELGVAMVDMRMEQDLGLDNWAATDLYWTFKRSLPEDPSEVLGMMPKKSRAEARKARKRHGLELVEGNWYTDDLYRMFLNNKHTLGSPAPDGEHFARLLQLCGDDVYVHMVSRQGQPLSAVMSFGFGDTLIAYYAGTAEGADRQYSASNFMYMALQEWASAAGFKTFDFCRSRAGTGAYKFKVHQGFEASPLNYRYFLVKAKEKPSFNPSNPKTQVLQKTWRRLPRWAVESLGKRLYGYLV